MTIKTIIDEIFKKATTNLNPLKAFSNFVFIAIFVTMFNFSLIAIQNGYITEYFNILVICFLIFISINFVQFGLDNGYLGLANLMYFTLGIMAGISSEFKLIKLGLQIVMAFWILTIVALIYKWYGRKKWPLKSLKQ